MLWIYQQKFFTIWFLCHPGMIYTNFCVWKSGFYLASIYSTWVFPVVRFFKKYIFGIYMLWEVSGYKNFLGQNLSWNQFYQEPVIFQHFLYFITYMNIHTYFCWIALDFYSLFWLVGLSTQIYHCNNQQEK